MDGCVASRSAPLEHKQGRLFEFSHIMKQAKAALAGMAQFHTCQLIIQLDWIQGRARLDGHFVLWCHEVGCQKLDNQQLIY